MFDVLNFTASTLSHSNLNGGGPDGGQQIMLISHVGRTPNGTSLDLLVTADEHYKAFKPAKNGISDGGFGRLNLAAGATSTMHFTFVDSNLRPVELDQFVISLYDFDAAGKPGSLVNVELAAIGGFDRYVLADDTQVAVTNSSDGLTTFTATQKGTGADNPTQTADGLTELQLARSVTLYFSKRAGFDITIEGGSGRNFMMSGATPFPVRCMI